VLQMIGPEGQNSGANFQPDGKAGESGRVYDPEDQSLQDFYTQLFASANHVEELGYGFTAIFPNIDVPLEVISTFSECELMQSKVRYLDGYMAVARCAKDKLIILREEWDESN
jgi:hypothetical protein